MLTIIIIEGPYGAGKSTIQKKLKNSFKNVTQFGFTGWSADDENYSEMYNRRYWEGIIRYFEDMGEFCLTAKADLFFICDRFFLSELALAPLYKKNYHVDSFQDNLFLALAKIKANIYYISLHSSDKSIYQERLQNKDRIGKENSISVPYVGEQSIIQDKAYRDLLEKLLNGEYYNKTANPIMNIISHDVSTRKTDILWESSLFSDEVTMKKIVNILENLD